jgi:spore maturation protein CgeB
MNLVIAGGNDETNLGTAFQKAAHELNLNPILCNTLQAYEAPGWLRRVNWYLRGRYPSQLKAFSQQIVQTCLDHRPHYLLTTGIAPVSQSALKQLATAGIKTINFLTDDPWNRAHYAPWFFKALPHYDIIYSPRKATMEDLTQLGCRRVEYLPFGYDPALFYPESNGTQESDTPDVLFAGGGDRDRVPYIHALHQANVTIELYGNYWDRYPETRHMSKGLANVQHLRWASQRSKITLCLVRRANRDGHCMRTFEAPAMGACMITEDTLEHREIFGPEGNAVFYFSSAPELVEKTRYLLEHEQERQHLAKAGFLRITQGNNTYRDRLKTILSI